MNVPPDFSPFDDRACGDLTEQLRQICLEFRQTNGESTATRATICSALSGILAIEALRELDIGKRAFFALQVLEAIRETLLRVTLTGVPPEAAPQPGDKPHV